MRSGRLIAQHWALGSARSTITNSRDGQRFRPAMHGIQAAFVSSSPNDDEKTPKPTGPDPHQPAPVPTEEEIRNQRIDPRVWPIAASTLITGSAIGVILPVMPQFAAQMGLSTAEFGLVGSVFGATRLFSNIPLAIAAERFGRRHFLTTGPMIAAVSMAGTGLATNLPSLLGWRVITGAGASAQMTGASLYLADISTPANRARTMAPMSAAFSAGASVGPAIGGYLADTVGVGQCFFFVGGAIGCVSAINYALLPETKKPGVVPMKAENVLSSTLTKWSHLSKDSNVRILLLTHLAYWFTLSGSQFTLMPLFAAEHLEMSAGATGSIFAMVSAVNVFGSQISAQISDRFGRKATILPGLMLITAAVACLPMASEGRELTAMMAVWAAGGASVATSPTAFMADIVSEEDRPQALAMLRSMGDLGLLLGAGSMGALATATSIHTAFQVNSALLATATALFAWNAVEPRNISEGEVTDKQPEDPDKVTKSDDSSNGPTPPAK